MFHSKEVCLNWKGSEICDRFEIWRVYPFEDMEISWDQCHISGYHRFKPDDL